MPRGSAKVCDNLEYDIANGIGQGRVVEDELKYVNNAAASGLECTCSRRDTYGGERQ